MKVPKKETRQPKITKLPDLLDVYVTVTLYHAS
jgi:hypothetical protein